MDDFFNFNDKAQEQTASTSGTSEPNDFFEVNFEANNPFIENQTTENPFITSTATNTGPSISIQRPRSSSQFKPKGIETYVESYKPNVADASKINSNKNPFKINISNVFNNNDFSESMDDVTVLQAETVTAKKPVDLFVSNFDDSLDSSAEGQKTVDSVKSEKFENMNIENKKFYNDFLTKSDDLIAKTQLKLEQLNKKNSCSGVASSTPGVTNMHVKFEHKEANLGLPQGPSSSKSLIDLKTIDLLDAIIEVPTESQTILPPTEADLLFDINYDYNLNTETLKQGDSYFDLIGLTKSDSQYRVQQQQQQQQQNSSSTFESLFNVDDRQNLNRSPFKDDLLDFLVNDSAKGSSKQLVLAPRLEQKVNLMSIQAPEILISEPLNEQNENCIVPEDFFNLRNEVPKDQSRPVTPIIHQNERKTSVEAVTATEKSKMTSIIDFETPASSSDVQQLQAAEPSSKMSFKDFVNFDEPCPMPSVASTAPPPLPTTQSTEPSNKMSFKDFATFDETFTAPSKPPVPPSPAKAIVKKKSKQSSFSDTSSDDDDDDGKSKFQVRIRPRPNKSDQTTNEMPNITPLLPRPPKTKEEIETFTLNRRKSLEQLNITERAEVSSDEEKQTVIKTEIKQANSNPDLFESGSNRKDSTDSFHLELPDEDDDAPLEEFYDFNSNQKELQNGWILMIRYPLRDKSSLMSKSTFQKLTEIRAWTETIVKVIDDGKKLQLYYPHDLETPFHTLDLKSCYKFSDLCLQQFDTYTKINTFKLQEIIFREIVQIRPDRLFSLPEKFLKHFTKPKANALLDHMPFQFEIIKFGHLNYKYLYSFSCYLQEMFWKLPVQTRKQQIKSAPATVQQTSATTTTQQGAVQASQAHNLEEITVKLIDEYKCKLNKECKIVEQKCRTRVYVIAFINAEEPIIDIGLNDKMRHGKEIVGRYDIIPIKTETWIQPEVFELNEHIIDKDEFERTHALRCVDMPDNQIVEIMRFRTRPRRNFELPLHVKCFMSVNKKVIEIKIECMAAGSYFTNIADVYCQDIQIRLPLPDEWVYLFRVEKRFRYGALHSAKSRFGKFKGLDRFIGKTNEYSNVMLQATCGSGKYEQAFKSIVWRIDQLPAKNKDVYKTQYFICKLNLQDYDTLPETFAPTAEVQYTMPICVASKCQVRSVSVNSCEEPPAKWVKLKTKAYYELDIEYRFEENAENGDSILPIENIDDLRQLSQSESEISNDENDEDDEEELKQAPVKNDFSLIDFL